MRLSATVFWAGLMTIALSGSVSVQAQSNTIGGPMLGFVTDPAGSTIWPIIGIPGASISGDRLEFDTAFRGAVISPKNDYAIAVRSEDAQVIIIDLAAAMPGVRSIGGLQPGADVLAISPAGSSAAAYDDESKTVHTVGWLPYAPAVIGSLDVSGIPGRAASIAVSDDGTVLLLKAIDDNGTALWVADSSGALWRVAADRPSAAAFLPNSHNAVVTDEEARSAFLLMDLDQAGTQVPVISAEDGVGAFSSAVASPDGLRIYLASADSGVITIVDRATWGHTQVSCGCRPTGFYQLKGTSIFRLNGPSSEPMTALEGSDGVARIRIIPPHVSMTGQQ